MNSCTQLALAALLAGAAASSTPASAQAARDQTPMGDIKMAQAAATDLTEGEVRKVDKDNGKLTIKHGEIRKLDMPPMTMVFGVKEKSMLDKLQPGDKVRFKVINEEGKFTVTEIHLSR